MITVKKIRNVLQLRDVILTVTAVFDEQREGVIKLTTRVSGIQSGQLTVDSPPSGRLFGSVLDSRNLLAAILKKKNQITSNYLSI